MSGVHTRAIVWSGVGIIAAVIVSVAAVFLLLRAWDLPASSDRVQAARPAAFPEPGLQSAPQLDLRAHLAGKEQRLHSFGWVDREGEVAHIPIEAAMDLLASRQAGEAKDRP